MSNCSRPFERSVVLLGKLLSALFPGTPEKGPITSVESFVNTTVN